MIFEPIALPYDYSALEPHIDARTMEIHYTKHHAGYAAKLNDALQGHEALSEKGIEFILKNLNEVPEEIRTAVRNNGGGFYNHNLFWTILSPNSESEASGELAEAINKHFGSFASFQEQFNNAAATRFGSGWAWLCKNEDGSELTVTSTANQDCPLTEGLIPIMGLDVWEHAYYLHYQNRRPDYISAFWNIINWEEVAKNYAS